MENKRSIPPFYEVDGTAYLYYEQDMVSLDMLNAYIRRYNERETYEGEFADLWEYLVDRGREDTYGYYVQEPPTKE